MKVFNLQCSEHHHFEGWFASEEDYAGQLARGLLACPLCGEKSVHKLPSAPRLNFGAAQSPAAERAAAPVPREPQQSEEQVYAQGQALQAAWLQAARRIMQHTEDVGERFVDEARRIHYGESEERGIRGRASVEQTRELLEEGITVLPLPVGLNEPLQ